MTEPLTSEGLASIRETFTECEGQMAEWGMLEDFFAEEALNSMDRLLMEVDRLHALTTVTEEKVEQGAEAFYTSDHTGVDYPAWSAVCAEFPNVADTYRRGVRAALEAVLNGGEDE